MFVFCVMGTTQKTNTYLILPDRAVAGIADLDSKLARAAVRTLLGCPTY